MSLINMLNLISELNGINASTIFPSYSNENTGNLFLSVSMSLIPYENLIIPVSEASPTVFLFSSGKLYSACNNSLFPCSLSSSVIWYLTMSLGFYPFFLAMYALISSVVGLNAKAAFEPRIMHSSRLLKAGSLIS